MVWKQDLIITISKTPTYIKHHQRSSTKAMPLSENAQVLETSNGLVETLRGAAGPHPGFRPGTSNTYLHDDTSGLTSTN
jgi:hypothetical protein